MLMLLFDLLIFAAYFLYELSRVRMTENVICIIEATTVNYT